MSIHHRFSRRRSPDPSVEPVLEALRAPARAGELRREDAAVAEFHAARLATAPNPRSEMTTARSAAAKALIATGTIVALTSGGFALAATGHLPTLPDQASDQATTSVAKNRATSPAPTTTTPTTTDSPTATSTPPAPTTTKKPKKPKKVKTPKPTPTTAPAPNLAGLCNAFQNGNKLDHGKSLDSAAFTALATAAGGKENIATYCVGLIGEPTVKPTKKPHPVKPTKPTKSAHPTKKPHPVHPTKKPHPVKPTKPAKPAKPSKG